MSVRKREMHSKVAQLTKSFCQGLVGDVIVSGTCKLRSDFRDASTSWKVGTLANEHHTEVWWRVSIPIPPEENTQPFGPTRSLNRFTVEMMSSLSSGTYSTRTRSTPWLRIHILVSHFPRLSFDCTARSHERLRSYSLMHCNWAMCQWRIGIAKDQRRKFQASILLSFAYTCHWTLLQFQLQIELLKKFGSAAEIKGSLLGS